MGLLKHAILPLYVILDAACVYQALVADALEDHDMMQIFNRDTTNFPITNVEKHLFDFVGGACLALLVNNIAAIFVENAHYRGMAVLLQIIPFIVDAYSYYRLGFDIPAVLYVIVGVGLVSLIVHSKEPGIFAKDKGSGKSKSG